MSLKERYDVMKAARATAFHGATYHYNTSTHGNRRIGVCRLEGEEYIVGFFDDSGHPRRVKSRELPITIAPDRLQGFLDKWAVKRKLEAFA